MRIAQTIVAAALLATLLSGCDGNGNEATKAERTKGEEAAKQERVRRDAEMENERKFLASTEGQAELERRLKSWLSAEHGLLVVTRISKDRRFFETHAFSSTTPWFVSCGRLGLTLTMGGWSDVQGSAENEVSSNDRFSLPLSRAKFDQEDCRHLTKVISANIATLIASPN